MKVWLLYCRSKR